MCMCERVECTVRKTTYRFLLAVLVLFKFFYFGHPKLTSRHLVYSFDDPVENPSPTNQMFYSRILKVLRCNFPPFSLTKHTC